jgi:hypothetical protein
MATFYVLPPRPLVRELVASRLNDVLPGLQWDRQASTDLLEILTADLLGRGDVFVVYREDVQETEDLFQGLSEHFGAEPGDTVVEVRLGGKPGGLTSRQWQLPRAA